MRNENKETYRFVGRFIVVTETMKIVSKFCSDNEKEVMGCLTGQKIMFAAFKGLEPTAKIVEITIKDNSTGVLKKLEEGDLLK